jgi:transposase, IS30 family
MIKIARIKENVYKHISAEERDEIALMLSSGSTKDEVAIELGRHPSTISREVKRNGSSVRKSYSAIQAQNRAEARSQASHWKERLKDSRIRKYVIKKLKQGYTPEQIAGRIYIDIGLQTNYESIYLFVYYDRMDLIVYLVRGHRKRRKRAIKSGKRMLKIPNRTMISERPEEINLRKSIGHWEADTVISRASKESLAVIRERKLQLMYIMKIKRKNAESFKMAIIRMMKKLPKKYRKSITLDNGLENSAHEEIARILNLKIYFCNPYHSWEKGGIENGIGLIRRDCPKKTNFALISKKRIATIEKKLNNRPRKSLGFLTPLESFKNCA